MPEKHRLAQYPFSPRSFQTGSHRLSFVDEGHGPAVVVLHGNPTWSYMYRNLIKALYKRYRLIAPDHLGCGFSDKPQRYHYTMHNHTANLEALLDYLDIQRCVLVVHDWGGAIGMGWAGRHTERVAGIVVLNTSAFRSPRIPLRIALCRLPVLGSLLVRGLNVFARAALSMAVVNKLAPDVAAGFLAPYDSWANRIALLRFVQDIPLVDNHPSWPDLIAVENGLIRLRGKPMIICWGGRDFCFNDHFYHEWQQRFPDARCHYFPNAGHYVLEDALPAIAPLIETFAAACFN